MVNFETRLADLYNWQIRVKTGLYTYIRLEDLTYSKGFMCVYETLDWFAYT